MIHQGGEVSYLHACMHLKKKKLVSESVDGVMEEEMKAHGHNKQNKQTSALWALLMVTGQVNPPPPPPSGTLAGSGRHSLMHPSHVALANSHFCAPGANRSCSSE